MLAVIGTITTIITVFITIVATRRWGTRRARVQFEYRFTSLLAADNARKLVKVTYKDDEVRNPHIATIRFKNIGSRDVSSASFDKDRPIVIDLGCVPLDIVGSSAQHSDSDSLATINRKDGVVHLNPGLLRKKDEWEVEVIVSGKGRPSVTSPLIDVDLVTEPTFTSSGDPGRKYPVILISIILSGILFVSGLALVIYWGINKPSTPFHGAEIDFCLELPDRSLSGGQKCSDVIKAQQEANKGGTLAAGLITMISAAIVVAVGLFVEFPRRRAL